MKIQIPGLLVLGAVVVRSCDCMIDVGRRLVHILSHLEDGLAAAA